MSGPVAFAERSVALDGLPVRYAEGGQGLPLVHVTGDEASRAAGESAPRGVGAGPFRATPGDELLARHFRVLVFNPAGVAQAPDAVAALVRAIDALGLGDFALLGTSAGATTAIQLALQAPARVTALVLEAPTTIRPDARDGELERQLAALPTPTLVLLGTRDSVVPPAVGRVYKERLVAGHLVFVYDAGHAISADRPEAFAEVVLDFLERREAFVISRATTLINP